MSKIINDKMIKIKESSLVDLSRHAVIEASAGTGKTTTLVNLIARLLIEKRAGVEEIVVVTFTEKATGELKQRVRAKLNELLKVQSINRDTKELLKSSEENFDKMLIVTIHGFCNRILNEYSFENRESFQKELVSDGSLYPKILHKIMRKEWYEVYGDELESVLELSDFTENGRTFENVTIEIASKYRPECGDLLIPEPQTESDIVKSKIKKFTNKLNELIEPVGDFDTNEGCRLYREYVLLEGKINKSSFNTRLKNIIIPLLGFFTAIKRNDSKIRAFKEFYKTSINCSGFDDDNGYFLLFSGVNKAHQDFDFKNNLPSLYLAVELLEELRELFKSLNKVLLSDTVYSIKQALENYKKDNGQMSFDDMLNQVNRSLDNERFLRILQDKYKYALVDEFQDTDRIQWEIFKKVFLNDQNKLIVVGDPKQSIYGFRNADVNIYIEAKDEMTAKHDASFYLLNTNYRSTKKLINDFNNFFTNGGWFADESTKKIEYQLVDTPSDESKISSITFNESARERSGISIINLGKKTAKEALYRLSYRIVKEIKYLLNNRDKIILQSGDNLNESDICIIVRKSREAGIIEEELTRNNIKASFYKKAGLFQSNEALNLKYLLASLMDTDDISSYKKALLTDFFGIKLVDVNKYEEVSIESRLKLIYEKWAVLAENREWSKLFQSILYDTGLSLRLLKNEEKTLVDSERAITNYKHIFEILEEEAVTRRLDIYKLSEHLTGLINNSIFTQINEDLHRLETEEQRVKIMTIHASKGLEFPIVFLFGGFTSKSSSNYFRFHDDDNRIIFDLSKDKKNKSLHDGEELEEAKRLYYVAFTRAKHKLYIPYFEPEKKSGVNPIVYKMNDSINKVFGADYFLEESVVQDDIKKGSRVKDENRKDKIKVEKLFPEIKKEEFDKRKITIHSFSSINAKIIYEVEDETSKSEFGENRKEEDEITAPVEGESTQATYGTEITDLPGGTGVGLMFHAIFENIDFESVNKSMGKDYTLLEKDEKVNALITKYFDIYLGQRVGGKAPHLVKAGDRNNEYFDKVIKIIHATLNTQIGENNIILSGLKNEDRIHEIEFYLPAKIDKNTEIFINGFIDMVFKHDGRYYLLDWKSNYLPNGYAGESFYKEVEQHYALQYKIYYIAFIEWLKKRSREFDYNTHFGGIYYLYLRGMDENNNGVFHYRPGEMDYEKIKNELIKFVAGQEECNY